MVSTECILLSHHHKVKEKNLKSNHRRLGTVRMCKSKHNAVCLKFMHRYMSIIPQKNWKK